MEKLSIISYELKKCKVKQKLAIQRAINGYKDYSYNQKYQYIRKGILDGIPHKYLNNGVIILNVKDKNKVLAVLKKNKASITVIDFNSKTAILH
ncbi:MAG: hypothetical protein AABX07_06035 [Nanoarchaeota archaeon]